jgi:hypothetical protein
MMARLSEGRQSTLGRFRISRGLSKNGYYPFDLGSAEAGPLPPAIRIQRILGSQLRRMEVVQAMLPAETSARLTMEERLRAILGSNLSVGRDSARSERLICEPCGV